MKDVLIKVCVPFFFFPFSFFNAEIYSPTDAVTAGFLDRVVAESDLQNEARNVAVGLAKLNRAVHTATKLRTRAGSLKSVQAGIATDEVEFRKMLNAA